MLAFFLFVPRIAQDETYHLFADSRTIWGIANFWNVASNIPFAVVGLIGLWKLPGVLDRVLFTGVLLTFSDRPIIISRERRTPGMGSPTDDAGFHGASDVRHRRRTEFAIQPLASRVSGDLRRCKRVVVEHYERSSLLRV